jgi:hypothetical protein
MKSTSFSLIIEYMQRGDDVLQACLCACVTKSIALLHITSTDGKAEGKYMLLNSYHLNVTRQIID